MQAGSPLRECCESRQIKCHEGPGNEADKTTDRLCLSTIYVETRPSAQAQSLEWVPLWGRMCVLNWALRFPGQDPLTYGIKWWALVDELRTFGPAAATTF
jgi:hypothetical protein